MQQELEKRDEVVVDNTDYIEAIKSLKENSVDRSKYDAVRAENKKLLDAIVNGQEAPKVNVKPKADVQELRNKLFDGKTQTNNLDYISTALELRKALIENGEEDPFLPHGNKIAATQQDIEAAERVAEGLQAMVDYADGDPIVFQNEYQRRVRDTIPSKRR